MYLRSEMFFVCAFLCPCMDPLLQCFGAQGPLRDMMSDMREIFYVSREYFPVISLMGFGPVGLAQTGAKIMARPKLTVPCCCSRAAARE